MTLVCKIKRSSTCIMLIGMYPAGSPSGDLNLCDREEILSATFYRLLGPIWGGKVAEQFGYEGVFFCMAGFFLLGVASSHPASANCFSSTTLLSRISNTTFNFPSSIRISSAIILLYFSSIHTRIWFTPLFPHK